MIKDRYGKQAIVNLLGTNMVGSKEGEATLSSLFHVRTLLLYSFRNGHVMDYEVVSQYSNYCLCLLQSQHKMNKDFADIPHILFDYHQEVRGTRGLDRLEHQINPYIAEYGFYYFKAGKLQR